MQQEPAANPDRLLLWLFPGFYVAILLRLSWWQLSPILADSNAPAWVQAVGSIGAILVAVWVVSRQHQLELARQCLARRTARIELCDSTLTISMRQFNWLLNFQEQVLRHYEHDPMRHLNMPPLAPKDPRPWAIDNRELAFLLRTSAKDATLSWFLSDADFEAAVDAINERSAVHRQEFQARLEMLGVAHGQQVEGTPQALEALIGPRITGILKRSTDDVFLQVHRALERLATVGTVVPAELAKVLPGATFLRFEPPSA